MVTVRPKQILADVDRIHVAGTGVRGARLGVAIVETAPRIEMVPEETMHIPSGFPLTATPDVRLLR